MDTSIRLTKPLDVLLTRTAERGGIFLPLATGVPQAVLTHPWMYRYLPTHSTAQLTEGKLDIPESSWLHNSQQ